MSIVFALILLVASYAITALTATKPRDATPATQFDFGVPQSAEGTPQMVVFGDVWSDEAMVLWMGDYRTEAIRAKGKK